MYNRRFYWGMLEFRSASRMVALAFALLQFLHLPLFGMTVVQQYVQTGHSERVTAAAFSPDGRFVLTGSYDKTARLWDSSSGREIHRFVGHTGIISSVAFAPNGRLILTGGYDHTARLWDVFSGKEVHQFETALSDVESVVFSPDGENIGVGTSDGMVHVWNIGTGHQISSFGSPSTGVRSVAFSPDGKFILTGGDDSLGRLWELASGREVQQYKGHLLSVLSVAFSKSGRYVLTGSEDNTGRLWDAGTGHLLLTFAGHQNKVTSVKFSPDEKSVVTGSYDRTARLWDVSSGRELREFDGNAGSVESVTFSPKGDAVLTGNGDNTARLWAVETGREIRSFSGSSNRVQSVAISPDGGFFLTAIGDNVASLWEVANGSEVRRFRGHSESVESVAFSPDGRFVLTGSTDRTARAWDPGTGDELQRYQGHVGGVSSAAFLPDGKQILTASWDRTARLWDFATLKEIRKFSGETGVLSLVPVSAAVSPDGLAVLTAGGDGIAHLSDVASGREVLQFRGHSNAVSAVAFSPSGKLAITGSWDLTARTWNVATGQEIRRFGVTSPVTCAGFSPDGETVLIGTGEGKLGLWNHATGKQVHRLEGQSDWISSAKFSADGKYILSGSFDGTTRIWDTRSGDELASLVSSNDGGWIVTRFDGRFDTSELDEGTAPISWIVDDDPLRALPPEIFMRDYYEPKLLPRLLSCSGAEVTDPGACKKEFKAVRPLGSLNRVQPLVKVEKAEWVDAGAGLARVTVKVSRNKGMFPRDGKQVEVSTGAYDLRLFRDGQLVGWGPKTSVEWQLLPPPTGPKTDELDLERWREKTEVRLDSDGTRHIPFLVQVPRRADLKQVTFTAYAFNEDRVKSTTASSSLKVETPLKPRTGKAYIISVGVNRTDSSPMWDLKYAANDARQMSKVVGDNLERTRQFSEVVRVRLVSDVAGQQETGEAAATKVHLQAVLDVLAGRRQLDEALKRDIPDIEKVEKAQPEDLVLLSFSSHGYTDDRGVFHIVLSDIGKTTPQDKITPELQSRSLSSDVLSGWLREVDAGEMTMIVDACHSEATVAAEGFKPGPMGSRGLGQLAYDKGMRILAASKSNEEAMELGGNIKQGLLSYALVEEGLVEAKAAKDGKILMSDWLVYGEHEVPNLYKAGKVKGPKGEESVASNGKDIIYLGHDQLSQAYQQPVLFDFNKQKIDTLLSTK